MSGGNSCPLNFDLIVARLQTGTAPLLVVPGLSQDQSPASRYNQVVVKRAAVLVVLLAALFCPSLPAEDDAASARPLPGQTMLVIPFENASPTPGLEWIGVSFPETFHQQLNSPLLYLASREERLRAYDRQGIPAGLHPSRATLYRIAEQMDVDYAVLGSYRYDGATLTVTAQVLDMRAQKLSPALVESGTLADLGTVQSALAWDLLHLIRPNFAQTKDKYIASVPAMRLDALEQYVRGILAPGAEEKVQHYREAVRLNPAYGQAWLALGETYYAQHDYEAAIAALSQIDLSSPISGLTSVTISGSTSGALAREANFYLGLAALAHGDFAKADGAFEFVAARLPLAEIYNDLGVVAARRGQRKKAADDFARAVQNDPSDPDYHFNLALTLLQSADRAAAARELQDALDRRPNDPDARTLLDNLKSTAGNVPAAGVSARLPLERIKRNYEEDAFRQMTMQMGSWAEQRFARSDPRAHARFHVELGKELLAHGFTAEAAEEFRHAAAIDPSSAAALAALAESASSAAKLAEKAPPQPQP